MVGSKFASSERYVQDRSCQDVDRRWSVNQFLGKSLRGKSILT